VAQTEDADGFYTCERCGRRKQVGSNCTSCGEGASEPRVPEGWDPELTRSERPRLQIVGRAEGDGPRRPRGDQPGRDHRPGHGDRPEQSE
jgi:ribosomal protein L37E